jgi:hypothetical protein
MNPSSDTLDVNPPVPEVKKVTLDNLFNSTDTRSLACQPGDIAGLTVGEYTITKIISQNGGHGLVVVCVDNSGVKWAMKIERENQKTAVDNLAKCRITRRIYWKITCTSLVFKKVSTKAGKKSPSWSYSDQTCFPSNRLLVATTIYP